MTSFTFFVTKQALVRVCMDYYISGQEGKNHRVPLKVYTKMVISLKLVNQIHPNFQDINF